MASDQPLGDSPAYAQKTVTWRSGVAFPDDATPAKMATGEAQAVTAIQDVRVSDIQPGQEWLFDGEWVKVAAVEVHHPDDRVSISYEMDGEVFVTRGSRGSERAAVRPGPVDASPARVDQRERERVRCDENCGAFDEPRTLDEYMAALTHWQSHHLLDGCSHAC